MRGVATLWMGIVLLNLGNAHAQMLGSCISGSSEAYVDIGNMRARVMNNGNLFGPWLGPEPNAVRYEVPRGSGLDVLRTANLWMGGLIKDSLHVSAADYESFVYAAGPLDEQGKGSYDCDAFDEIASLYREDIERYNRLGVVSERLRAWPWRWGAPVLDGDGDPSNYNLAGGDRPGLLGDQSHWWVMHDSSVERYPSQGTPIGLEVKTTAYGFDSEGVLGHSLFIRYQLRYKGETPLEQAYIGMFAHAILGSWGDEYIGSDTTLGMAYFYNGDNYDDDGYGEAPPAFGLSFLRGPRAMRDGRDNDRDGEVDEPDEQLRATNIMSFGTGASWQGNPRSPEDNYNYLKSKWLDGESLTVGGYGKGYSDESIAFAFPGDPLTGAFWSEVNGDNKGTPNTPVDRRLVMAAGPFRMEPGDTEELVVAFVWSRGSSYLGSVRKLREDMRHVQFIAPTLLQPLSTVAKTHPEPQFDLGYHRNYPNPFSARTTIRYSLNREVDVTLIVYDVLGRAVETLVNEKQESGWHEAVFDATELAAGTYMYRLQVGTSVATETMVVAR